MSASERSQAGYFDDFRRMVPRAFDIERVGDQRREAEDPDRRPAEAKVCPHFHATCGQCHVNACPTLWGGCPVVECEHSTPPGRG